MKRFFAIMLLSFSTCILHAQQSGRDYRIAEWFNDKKAAVSLTFDDAISGQFTVALPLLQAYGFKSTFFLTTSILRTQLHNWDLVDTAAAEGHEIANHSRSHPHFLQCGRDSIVQELTVSNQLIRENVPGVKALTHAYPFGEGGLESATDKEIRETTSRFFIGARATRNLKIAYNPYDFAHSNDNYYKINSTMIADSASIANFGNDLDATLLAGGWYVPTYHGIEDGWIIVKKKDFIAQLEALDKRKKDCWIAPFGEVLRYHKERNSAMLSTISEDKKNWTLSLTDTLPETGVWNHALTIHLKTGRRNIIAITQSGETIPFSVSGDWIVFNALPGTGKITCIKKEVL